MKKHLLVVLLLFSTVLIACAHGRKTTKKKTTTKATTSNTALRGLTSVMMRRGACFGKCPEYQLTVNSNGLVEYNGYRNTTPMGVYQKNIGTAKAQAMLKSFMDYRADTCVTLYTSRIADMPGLSFTLTQNGKKQLIGNAHFGPRFLVDLSEEMDALGKVDNTWKKISSVPNGD
jgi:hypothetical protein